MSQPEPARAGERSGAVAWSARADVRRNLEKLITAARAVFAVAPGGQIALEAIACQAGVGIGTLYRHFSTREALVEAVYAAELDDVVASASVLLGQFPPDVALRAWMDRYATFWVTKHAMLGKEGSLRTDIRPDDVVTLPLGVFLSTVANDTQEQASRLLDLVVDALRPQDSTAENFT